MRTLRLRDYVTPGDACHFALHALETEERINVHRHDFTELFWVVRGNGVHWVNGQRRALRPGLLTLIRADDEHTVSAIDGRPFHIINIAFATRIWKDLQRRYYPGRRDLFAPSPIEQREFDLGELRWGELQHAAGELHGGQRTRVAIERFLLNLRHLLVSSDESLATGGPQPLPRWLADACRLMASPECFHLSTRAIADRAGKSPEHLARAVKSHLGKTPTDVMNDARMNHAAQRLAQTGDPILDIVLDCGFENVSHFYKLFQARFRTTPRRYRLRQSRIVAPV